MEPAEIKIIVFGAKGLEGRKKDRHKYSTMFGIGTKKYRTSVVNEPTGCPVWNEESAINVSDARKELTFKVLEKEDILGQIRVPLGDLTGVNAKRTITAPLTAHKKCPSPRGTLTYTAWISKYKGGEANDPDADKISLGGKMKQSLFSKSPKLPKKFGSFGKSPKMDKRSSQSMADLGGPERPVSWAVTKDIAIDEPPAAGVAAVGGGMKQASSLVNLPSAASMVTPTPPARRRLEPDKMRFSDSSEEEDLQPEITGISPKEGPVTGGTRLTIRGKNLGKDKFDVVGLVVCGSNCLATLEYESSTKIFCTTKPWKPTIGHLVVETQRGGKGVSLVQFSFKLPTERSTNLAPRSVSMGVIPQSSNEDTATAPVIAAAVAPAESPARPVAVVKSMDVDKPEEGSRLDPVVEEEPLPDINSTLYTSNNRTPSPSPKNKLKDKFDQFKAVVKDSSSRSNNDKKKSDSNGTDELADNILRSEMTRLLNENHTLLSQNQELHERNQEMKKYIEKLLTRVINECPDTLRIDVV